MSTNVNLGLVSLVTDQSQGHVVDDESIRGGLRVVATARQVVTEARLNAIIPFGRRKNGMVVFDTSTNETWQCKFAGTNESDGEWAPFAFTPNGLNGGTY